MTLTLTQDRSAAILAGIDPRDTITLDVDLSTLTVPQRTLIAESMGVTPQSRALPTIVGADPLAELIAGLDAEIVRRETAERERRERVHRRDAEVEAWIASSSIHEVDTQTECGVSWTRWDRDNIQLYEGESDSVRDRALARRLELDAEAKQMTAKAKAAVQPQIDAAKAKIEEEAKAKVEADRAEKLAKCAKRLETGVVEIPLSRGDRREWGEPWIAKVAKTNGRKAEYDFSAGSYDLATEILSIQCAPGEVISYGQKNYRKPKRTIHETRLMRPDGGLDTV